MLPSRIDNSHKNTGSFPQTRWSLIVDAHGEDPEALATLCQQYWQPLYIYARRKGSNPEDAEDLTQGFFVHILSKDFFAKAVPERGRLRTLLLRSFQNYTINEWKKKTAEKRGGGVAPLRIDAQPAEAWLEIDPESGVSPELEFERSWAREILQQARDALRETYAAAGKLKEFEAFADQLEIGKSERPYSEIAVELGIDADAARYIGFKLRQRFREQIEQTVTDTVATPEEAAEELNYVMGLFG